MRHNYETAASTLIEVDPLKRGQKLPSDRGSQANVSGTGFSWSRVSSGVNLRWPHPKELKKLSKNHRDDLVDWLHINDIKKLMKLLICQPRLIRERGKAVVNNSTRNMKVTTTGGRVQKKNEDAEWSKYCHVGVIWGRLNQ